MHIMRRRGWELPERMVTPEPLVLNRRGALAGAGLLASLAALPAKAQTSGSARLTRNTSRAGR